MTTKTTINNDDVEMYRAFQRSPIFFAEKMWRLTPQPIKPEHAATVKQLVAEGRIKEIKGVYFDTFIKNKHITWQQWLILLSVELALQKRGAGRISVRSGHGTGKSCTIAWLVLWYLFCFKDAQIPCTAPTSDQMHDILWKELAIWHKKMPLEIQAKYEWSTEYMRIVESPQTWFARAKTARKESPEALAGVHGDHVMALVDEASGVAEEIFNTAEGALTGPNVLLILISNGTRLVGYFYESHHKDSRNWQTVHLNSEESPIVDKSFVTRIIEKHGIDSDEYRVRVQGNFPKEEMMDTKGYVPLLVQNDIRIVAEQPFIGKKKLGIDPSGEGDDETTWIIRDDFKARVVCKEKTSTTKSIAQKTLSLLMQYDLDPDEIYYDNFGSGANLGQELALTLYKNKPIRAHGVNVGEAAIESDRFINLRAEAYWRAKEWLRKGGELIASKDWEELLTIRYRPELSGKLKIMGKREMKAEGYKSPNVADGLMLTFTSPDVAITPYRQPEWEKSSDYEN